MKSDSVWAHESFLTPRVIQCAVVVLIMRFMLAATADAVRVAAVVVIVAQLLCGSY